MTAAEQMAVIGALPQLNGGLMDNLLLIYGQVITDYFIDIYVVV